MTRLKSHCWYSNNLLKITQQACIECPFHSFSSYYDNKSDRKTHKNCEYYELSNIPQSNH